MDDVERLMVVLKSNDPGVRGKAAIALGRIAEANPGAAGVIVPVLVEAMKDRDEKGRFGAEIALEGVVKANPGTAGVIVPVLLLALKDENSDVRWEAADTLGRIANPTMLGVVVSALVGALNDEESRVRWNVAKALGKIVDKCDTLESLEMFENKLKEGAAALRKGNQSKDDIPDAMRATGELMNKVAAKKNELARNAMKEGGLILAGERPRPPKHGGMYRAGEKRLCIR